MNANGDIEYVKNGAVFWTRDIRELLFPFHAHVDFAFSGAIEYIMPTGKATSIWGDATKTLQTRVLKSSIDVHHCHHRSQSIEV